MFNLLFDEEVVRDLAGPSKDDQRLILGSLEKLASYYSDAYELELRKSGILRKLNGEWEGFFRLRMRSFRAIYKRYEDTLVVYVVKLRQRSDIAA